MHSWILLKQLNPSDVRKSHTLLGKMLINPSTIDIATSKWRGQAVMKMKLILLSCDIRLCLIIRGNPKVHI